MKKQLYISLIAATLFAVQVPGAANASSLTYDLALNPIFGPEGGTGSFTINAPPVGGSGILTAGNGGLTAMDFKIDRVDFGLNGSSEVSYFYQGSTLVLASLFYGGAVGSDGLLSIAIGSSGGYFFTDSAAGGSAHNTIGSISVSSTPIPTTLPLLATGLGALAMLGWWRKRKIGAAFAT